MFGTGILMACKVNSSMVSFFVTCKDLADDYFKLLYDKDYW